MDGSEPCPNQKLMRDLNSSSNSASNALYLAMASISPNKVRICKSFITHEQEMQKSKIKNFKTQKSIIYKFNLLKFTFSQSLKSLCPSLQIYKF